ncbi:hypothetical protein Taro_050274 [Colocasia esculenta]|uniref:Uncharacterized protein n=1 Tax=Colocasia esculenta TaxID=4460 RepID=A0A843XDN4_COLES|nr:hypothetical protein [Colocasia esculenta]
MYLNGSLKLMEWIKEKDIFLKTYTFVPIGPLEPSFFVQLGKIIQQLLQSVHDPSRFSYNFRTIETEPTIRRFIKDLYHTQGKLASHRTIGSILLLLPKNAFEWCFKLLLVPQQRDGEECCVFALYYTYVFLKSASPTFSFASYPSFVLF